MHAWTKRIITTYIPPNSSKLTHIILQQAQMPHTCTVRVIQRIIMFLIYCVVRAMPAVQQNNINCLINIIKININL